MKQHITIDQLLELSPKAKKKLELWCFEKRYFTRHPVPGEPARFSTTDTYENFVVDPPLPSIGQMIEFFDGKCNLKLEQDLKYWTVKTSNGRFFQHFELCDALWEAVKEVLNQKRSPFDEPS